MGSGGGVPDHAAYVTQKWVRVVRTILRPHGGKSKEFACEGYIGDYRPYRAIIAIL